MKEKEKMFLLYINIGTLVQVSKHQYLISRYHWKSWENFIELSADSAFSFLSIGSKTKTRNWRKTFYNRFIANYTSLTSTRGLRKLL